MASYKYTFQSGDTLTPARLNDARDAFDIVNADIKSDAAIAGTKIAPDFGSQNVVTTGTLSSRAATFVTGSPDRIGTEFTSNAISTLNFGSPNNSEGNAQIQYNRTSGVFVINGGATGAQIERMRIDASGNVGIGTSTPGDRLDVDGFINISESYKVDGTAVVSNRRTGWSAPTGTATRTSFATSTVTTAQLAERVKALIDDLTAHGLIGT